ncbi:uncharacterized protein EV422DRAFT_513985 [Fimicolochytrium jonesii]|uniref:uncharacterized protein n=1 Tax=Fimicolochytrium jonesii TaxID=1396493 RepID=UPI0022FDE370|nr:uncharacterized protein EV422DRAFT_513985 [Fimicolochytrium jonesii]KAI8825728.1 hypothetical protein EV422DRAFT_513985 [Fimicolochytrium jonesii]
MSISVRAAADAGSGALEGVSSTFSNLMARTRKATSPSVDWRLLPQPVPLVKVISQPIAPGSNSIKYVATGITPQAEQILTQLEMPIHVVAFTGFGRSGKSFTASKIRSHLTGNDDHKFISAPGNVPCTHGIDMLVFDNPRGPGTIVFLDCEGGANHNQTALPFVIGLAARLSTRMYAFERGCFTTGGLDTVMQVINMGHATSGEEVDMTRELVLVENMTINGDIPDRILLDDLLSEIDGDEQTNRVRSLIRERFSVRFAKLPFNMAGNTAVYNEAIATLADSLAEDLQPSVIGGVPVDGSVIVQLINELLAQIRDGGNRYNMISATEALVANMAAEAANAVWTDFIARVRKQGNHPVQVNGRKHLRTILREVEGAANTCLNDLESFTTKLVPAQPAAIAKTTWDRNYRNFEMDIRAAHKRKADDLAKYTQWADKLNRIVSEVVAQVVEAIRQFIRFARFSTSLVLMGNYYFWSTSLNVVTGIAQGVIAGATS